MPWRWGWFPIAMVLALLVLSDCGGAVGNPVVLRIGGVSIHKSALERGLHAIERVAGKSPSDDRARDRALSRLIYSYWAIAEAKAQHLVSAGNLAPGPALEAEARRAGEALRRSLTQRPIRLAPEEVAAYYKDHLAHLEQFYVPEQRLTDMIGVLQTHTEAEKLKRSLGTGARFRSKAERRLVKRPSRFGRGVSNNNQLLEAIFQAKVGEVPPPVELDGGWDLVIVRQIVPAHSQPFQQARPAVIGLLREKRRVEELNRFASDFRRRWPARTSCSAGFVVQGCAQYAGPSEVGGEPPLYLPS